MWLTRGILYIVMISKFLFESIKKAFEGPKAGRLLSNFKTSRLKLIKGRY